MAEVDVGQETYTTYADVDTADIYAEAAIHATAWQDLGSTLTADLDAKGRALVSATRTLDRQVWLDAYNTFELRAVEQPIIDASIELAIALLDGSDVQNVQTGVERIKSMSAGSVSITNFRGIDSPTRFPQIVQELLRGYLGSSGTGGVAQAFGVDAETTFPIDLSYGTGGL